MKVFFQNAAEVCKCLTFKPVLNLYSVLINFQNIGNIPVAIAIVNMSDYIRPSLFLMEVCYCERLFKKFKL